MSASSSHGPSASVSAVSTPINAGNRPESAPAFGSSQPASTPPNSSSGGKFLDVKAEEKKSRRTSLQMLLPKLPSSDSAGPSPGPSSPVSPRLRVALTNTIAAREWQRLTDPANRDFNTDHGPFVLVRWRPFERAV
uniref:Uncharacterized protein n=1 Tax=Anopheles atroparvus TaxID=41427 RepID=A0A182JDD5_ANOAO